VKALSFVAGPAAGPIDPGYDYTTFPRWSARPRTPTARPGSPIPGRSWPWPRCTTASRRPSWSSWRTWASPSGARPGRRCWPGTFDRDGELPVNPDGGLKSFGHPIGASGLRMLFECWLQLRGEAPPDRQIATVGPGRTLGLTHNLGGRRARA
jgi:acetyl-CoA C-acetyltransferase